MNEYIVTCRSYEDLENLYDDMETPWWVSVYSR